LHLHSSLDRNAIRLVQQAAMIHGKQVKYVLRVISIFENENYSILD